MPLHTGRFGGAIDDIVVTDDANGEALFRENFDDLQLGSITGRQVHTNLTVYAGATFPRWTGGGGNHSHAVDRATNRIANVEASTRNIAAQIFSGPHEVSSDPRAAKLQETLKGLASRLALLEYARPNRTHVLAVQDVANPHDATVYVRGNFRTLGHRSGQCGHAARAC
jgi:hypothetical protein